MKEGKKNEIKPKEMACVFRYLPEAFSSSAFISVYLCASVDSLLLPDER
jgi:hypothetical protein